MSDNNNFILTNPVFSEDQQQKFCETINSPQYKNYATNQIQKQLYENINLNKSIQAPKNLMVEEQKQTNELIQFTNEQISELQNQLKDSKVQLKQANDKIASQTLAIKQLKADLKEETEKRAITEDKLGSKDWKTMIISFVFALLVLAIEHLKDILAFTLSLMNAK